MGKLVRWETMSLIGMPPGGFELPIFCVVLARKTVRRCIVGSRSDLAETLAFATEGKVISHCMQAGKIAGRGVLNLATPEPGSTNGGRPCDHNSCSNRS